ncbi:MAG: substrate-binding domain-containing protein [Clostridiales bacterium]|nr:substrate-binding domain-containing protein [Clostridiales bacterium]
MKKILLNKTRNIEIILIIVILVLFAYGVFRTVYLTVNSDDKSLLIPKYHVAFFHDDNDRYNFDFFKSEFIEEGKQNEIVADFYEVVSSESVEYAFKSAWMTNVDVILIKVSNIDELSEYIIESENREIKIVIIGNDLPESNRDTYIGVNKYQLGKNSIELIERSNVENKIVGVILGSEYGIKTGAYQNSYLNALQEFSNQNDDIWIAQVEYSAEKRAELIVQDWIINNKVNFIICTDVVDSVRVVNTLIDLNAISDVSVITNGKTDEIIEYIQKGTVHGSIFIDYEKGIKQAVKLVVDLSNSKRVSSYIPINIEIIDDSNIGEY